jgi:lysophospholipase L1-like esterase
MYGLRLVSLAAAYVAVVAAALPTAASAKTAKQPAPHYYLALGDSLSQGMQPDLHGVTRDTDQGYTNDLLATERRHVHNLQLVALGCGGDTTTSLLTGKGNEASVKQNHCDRRGGSQEAAAIHFLKTHHHRGEVPLITVDIGANDVDGCAALPASQVVSCVESGLATINQNLPKIFAGLEKAAPKGTTFASMNLYDPILGGWFGPVGSSSHNLALESLALVKALDDELGSIDARSGFLTADVAGAFNTYDMTDTVTWESQQVPAAIANLCSWTWACQTPPSGPNIHANKNGYQVIANAFSQVIGNRLH